MAAESRRREAARTGGDVAAEGRGGDAPGGDLRPEEAVGQLRPQRHHSGELEDHPGADAPGGLRGGPTSWCTCGTGATGRDYWRALGRLMPDYERRREDLRQRGWVSRGSA